MTTKNQIEARLVFKDNVIFYCSRMLEKISYENFTGMTEEEIGKIKDELRLMLSRLTERVEEL